MINSILDTAEDQFNEFDIIATDNINNENKNKKDKKLTKHGGPETC